MLGVLISIGVLLGKFSVKEVLIAVTPSGQLSDTLVSLTLIKSVLLITLTNNTMYGQFSPECIVTRVVELDNECY